MTASLAGLPLRYLIGVDNPIGFSNTITEGGYHTSEMPSPGIGAGYINRRQEEGGRLPGIEYIDPPDDIEQDYGEPPPVFGTEFFWANIDTQCRKLIAIGIDHVEIDNLDTDTIGQALELIDHVATFGLRILLKNPLFLEGDQTRLVKHPFVEMIIHEQDNDVFAEDLNNLRKDAGRPELPIRVVTWGGERSWAQKIANAAIEAGYLDFGVTHSPQGEYETVENILVPVMTDVPPVTPPSNPKPWNATLEADIGRFHDGPDVPMLAQQVARAFPEDDALAKYVTMAGTGTAWCGIYCAWKLSRWGIKPPFGSSDVARWMYVDAWKTFGTSIPPAQREDGDLCLWLGNPHHISFAWQGRYLGGNQSNTVNISSFRTPDVVRRPPAPVSAPPQPEVMPLLMIESNGDAVRTLQTMLQAQGAADLEIDGEFGPATEAAVKTYQAARGLEVDGIVGTETWTALFAGEPIEPPEEHELLSSDQVIAIMRLAQDSAVAKYSWQGRGVMPLGCVQGLAVIYAQCLLKLEANDSAVLAMSAPIGSNAKDALAYYGIQATGRQNVLRKAMTLLYGLSMRESSGNYTEGRDTTASNVTSDTAEAGLFQQSWNSSSASNELKKLLPAYQGNKQPCHVAVFKVGITQKLTKSFGSGAGYEYQELAKSCPAFATEMAAVGIRVLYNHWGPLVRQEAEFRAEAEALLLQVDRYMAEQPEPPPLPDEIAVAKAACMASIEAAVDKLIKDLATL